MTAALFALCAMLAIQTPIWIFFACRAGEEMKGLDAEIAALRDHAARDGRLLQEAQRLLRDPRARGKNVRHSAWTDEVDAFTKEWRGEV